MYGLSIILDGIVPLNTTRNPMVSVLFRKNLGVPHYTPTIYTSAFLGKNIYHKEGHCRNKSLKK